MADRPSSGKFGGLHENRATWDDAVRGFEKTMLERDPALTADIIQSLGRNPVSSLEHAIRSARVHFGTEPG